MFTKAFKVWGGCWIGGAFVFILPKNIKLKPRIYLFGFIPEHNDLYDELQKAGFVLKFKPVLPGGKNGVKGNIDADLILQTMIDYPHYDKAVLVTSDGDFYSLARYLYDNRKLEAVLSPHVKTCSSLLRKSAREKMFYMNTLAQKIGKRKSTA